MLPVFCYLAGHRKWRLHPGFKTFQYIDSLSCQRHCCFGWFLNVSSQ